MNVSNSTSGRKQTPCPYRDQVHLLSGGGTGTDLNRWIGASIVGGGLSTYHLLGGLSPRLEVIRLPRPLNLTARAQLKVGASIGAGTLVLNDDIWIGGKVVVEVLIIAVELSIVGDLGGLEVRGGGLGGTVAFDRGTDIDNRGGVADILNGGD